MSTPPDKDTTKHTAAGTPQGGLYYTDSFELRHRKDGLCLIALGASLPEGVYWYGRFLLVEKHVKILIDALCEMTGYYPEQTLHTDAPTSASDGQES